MGHQIIECDFCGSYVMEGHNDWSCKCGAICNAQTKYIWKREKALRITRCSDPLRWYVQLIGYTVPYLGDTGTEYKSRESSGFINFVQYKDAEIIKFGR